jgi:hypothetical protein
MAAIPITRARGAPDAELSTEDSNQPFDRGGVASFATHQAAAGSGPAWSFAFPAGLAMRPSQPLFRRD